MRARRPGLRPSGLGLGSRRRSYGCGERKGERTARRQGQPKRSKLDPHREFLLALIEAEPDITIAEMQERLRSEAGVTVSVGTVWTFLDRAGLTFKKRPPTRPSRSARTS
jgi:transposase